MESRGSYTELDDECVETAPYCSWEALLSKKARMCIEAKMLKEIDLNVKELNINFSLMNSLV